MNFLKNNDVLIIKENIYDIFLWKHDAIIQLMDFAKRVGSKELILEGIIMIIALFNGFMKISEIEPTKDSMNLTVDEKRDIHSILMEEIS